MSNFVLVNLRLEDKEMFVSVMSVENSFVRHVCVNIAQEVFTPTAI